MDDLIRAIAEAPDDDAPRLVWADREGGDRGELVVLQCAIAARHGTRADRVRMQARVRELLPRFAAPDETWRRGFCDELALKVDEISPEPFARRPLAQRLKIKNLSIWHYPNALGGSVDGVWRDCEVALARALAQVPHGRLRALEVHAYVDERGEGESPDVEHGRGDALLALLARTLPSLDEVCAIGGKMTTGCMTEVRQLGIRSLMGTCEDVVLPLVERFGPWNSGVNGATLRRVLFVRPDLVELDLWANDLEEQDLLQIAATKFTRLDDLGLGFATWTRDAAHAISALPITRLCAYTSAEQPAPPVSLLLNPRLRYLRLGRVNEVDLEPLMRSGLEELKVDQISDEDLELLRSAIPQVNDG